MSDPVNLNAMRAAKARDGRLWSVEDALRKALADVQSGENPSQQVYIAFNHVNDKGSAYPYLTAGLTNMETVGLLHIHIHDCLVGDET